MSSPVIGSSGGGASYQTTQAFQAEMTTAQGTGTGAGMGTTPDGKPFIDVEFHGGPNGGYLDVHMPDGAKFAISPDSLRAAFMEAGYNAIVGGGFGGPQMGGGQHAHFGGAIGSSAGYPLAFGSTPPGVGMGMGAAFPGAGLGGMTSSNFQLGGMGADALAGASGGGCSSTGAAACNCSGTPSLGNANFGHGAEFGAMMNGGMTPAYFNGYAGGGYSVQNFDGIGGVGAAGAAGGMSHGGMSHAGMGMSMDGIPYGQSAGAALGASAFTPAAMAGLGAMGGGTMGGGAMGGGAMGGHNMMNHGGPMAMGGGGGGGGHAGHAMTTAGGTSMWHPKDYIDNFMADPSSFWQATATGAYGSVPNGNTFGTDGQGNVTMQQYIDMHPAVYMQLYDEYKGEFEGDPAGLERKIAQEATNINDIDQIDQEYWDRAAAMGFPPVTEDHHLHQITSGMVDLAPGQNLTLQGGHTMDNLDNEEFAHISYAMENGQPVTYLLMQSNNNNSGNGHHMDGGIMVRMAGGFYSRDDIQNRVDVVDDNNNYRLPPALQQMVYTA